MDQLIKILKHDDEMVVSGRDLHDFLEVDTPYRIWIQRMIEYGFHENADYISFEQKSTKPQGGRPQVDHALKLDMAKEIAMIQRTDKGKQARQYFIRVQKAYQKQVHLPETPEEKIHLLLENSDQVNKRVEKIDTRLSKLEDDQPIAPGEYSYISTRVKHAVNGYIDIHHLVLNRKQRGMLYKDISRGLNEVTGVKTRTQLRKKDFDTADEFVTNWVPSTATLQIIKQLSDVPEGQTELIRR
ncbi:antA/AntB antirepressor family protein [Lentilactobacillus sp. G22-6]|uniref:antA/AntB antirepressor family protein n=1 Tax=Lentilactobacillus dabitei TaxID=2831523 RepID=UPI001C272EBD|nr:antA/AntB antirepressor family protein [Lentilactobacillus dabitei]MBU9788580.1 antA/AntB antirepressor family protein [Lentilactobacillus dabitei]